MALKGVKKFPNLFVVTFTRAMAHINMATHIKVSTVINFEKPQNGLKKYFLVKTSVLLTYLLKLNVLRLLRSPQTISLVKSNVYCKLDSQCNFFNYPTLRCLCWKLYYWNLKKKAYCRLPEVTYLKKSNTFLGELEEVFRLYSLHWIVVLTQ